MGPTQMPELHDSYCLKCRNHAKQIPVLERKPNRRGQDMLHGKCGTCSTKTCTRPRKKPVESNTNPSYSRPPL